MVVTIEDWFFGKSQANQRYTVAARVKPTQNWLMPINPIPQLCPVRRVRKFRRNCSWR